MDACERLLASTSLSDFLGQRPPSAVVKVDSDSMTLEQVLHLFASRNILSAPVVSSGSPGRCLGFVGVEDILRAVLSFASLSSIDAAVLSSSTPSAREEGLRRAAGRLRSTLVRDIHRSGDGSLVFRCGGAPGGQARAMGGGGGEEAEGRGAVDDGGGDEPSRSSSSPSLLDVVRDGFLLGGGEKLEGEEGERGHPVCHRVAVVDFDDDDEEEGETTRPPAPSVPPPAAAAADNFVGIVSQSDVVRFLARHPEAFPPAVDGEGGGGGGGRRAGPTASDVATSPVAAVPSAMPASLAFASLFEQQERGQGEGRGTVSAAAIVGVRGELVGCLSASDLRGLTPETLVALGLPVGEFVLERAAAAAAAESGREERGGSRRPPSLLAVPPDAPLSTLVRLLAEGGHHRAFVVEEDDAAGGTTRAIGIVTLSDVLRSCVGGR